jgi:uridine kinase
MIITTDRILDSINKLKKEKQSFLIGIDGHGASGKSRLSKELAKLDTQISLIHFDDFYFSIIDKYGHDTYLPEFDWQRLEREVLIPIQKGENTKYQRYNWELNKLDDWIDVKAGTTILVEGVSSLSSKIRDYFNFKIWIDCPLDIRLERAKKRDIKYNMDSMELWIHNWIPRENNHVISEKPYNYADLIIDGSGQKARLDNNELFVLNPKEIDMTYLENTKGNNIN